MIESWPLKAAGNERILTATWCASPFYNLQSTFYILHSRLSLDFAQFPHYPHGEGDGEKAGGYIGHGLGVHHAIETEIVRQDEKGRKKE